MLPWKRPSLYRARAAPSVLPLGRLPSTASHDVMGFLLSREGLVYGEWGAVPRSDRVSPSGRLLLREGEPAPRALQRCERARGTAPHSPGNPHRPLPPPLLPAPPT